MKGKISSFISGILVTIIFISLIGTAFASKGRVAVNVDYNDIRVTLDGEAVALVDANGNAVEPLAINGTTYLPVRAVANALGLEVDWNQETATVVLSSKPQRDGFNLATNQNVGVGNYSFSLPAYWEEVENTGTNYLGYAESDGQVAELSIVCSADDEEVSFEALYADNDNMILVIEERFEKCNVISYDIVALPNGAKGILYNYSFEQTIDNQKYTGKGKEFCFPSVEDNQWVFMDLALVGNTEYFYDDDFSKIINSIKTDPTFKPTTQEGSTNPPSGSSLSGSHNDGDMPDGSQMVYVTATGSRYHYDSTCNGGKYTLTTLENAKRRGLTPCQKCVLH